MLVQRQCNISSRSRNCRPIFQRLADSPHNTAENKTTVAKVADMNPRDQIRRATRIRRIADLLSAVVPSRIHLKPAPTIFSVAGRREEIGRAVSIKMLTFWDNTWITVIRKTMRSELDETLQSSYARKNTFPIMTPIFQLETSKHVS